MQRIDPPTVKPGQRVTALLFDKMRRAIRAGRLIAGQNVRLRTTPAGTMISFHGGQSFSCAWQVSLLGTSAATLLPGTVNKVPGAIKGKPLDGGEEGAAPPVLDFGKPKVDKDGRGWICAEVALDPKNEWSVVKVEVVQVADPDTEDGGPAKGLPNASGGSLVISGHRARHPLAMLRLRKSGRLDVFQVTCFDLQARAKLAADGKTATRVFFW